MNDCCNHDCDQGRDCPSRSRIQPETIYAWAAAVIFVIFTVMVIALMNPTKLY